MSEKKPKKKKPKKLYLAAIVATSLLSASASKGETTVYSWVTRDGKLYFTGSLDRVPKAYVDTVESRSMGSLSDYERLTVIEQLKEEPNQSRD